MQARLDSNMNIANFEHRIQEILQKLSKARATGHDLTSPEKFEEIEKEVCALMREQGDLHTAIHVQMALDSSKKKAGDLARSMNKGLKNKGLRRVHIRFIGGTEIPIIVTYYARNCDIRRTNAKNCYPGLIMLGVYDGCSAELASEISMTCAALCSLEEAQNMLKSHGCDLDIKTIRNVMKRFSARARITQELGECACSMTGNGKGRRIVASTDGGRIRVRKTKRGPKTKKGRHRYHTDWREPKLIIIYLVDEHGRSCKRSLPIIDGAIGGPDYAFEQLLGYLKQLDITADDQILFVADGALWIWDRVDDLKKALSLKNEQVYELLDFYHAVEHLNDIAKLKHKWSERARKQWVSKHRSNLKTGKIDEVIKAVRVACTGSKIKLLERERDYFIKNQRRMAYNKMSRLKFPMGSGAMESTVRRVVNLRLKSPGIFWHEDTANEMIMLRAYYKSHQWEIIKKMSSKVHLEAVA